MAAYPVKLQPTGRIWVNETGGGLSKGLALFMRSWGHFAFMGLSNVRRRRRLAFVVVNQSPAQVAVSPMPRAPRRRRLRD
jgi:hypothetical protein